MENVEYVIEGDLLTCRVGADRLGFTAERIWNPSPSVLHRTEAYDVPYSLDIGIAGNHDTGAKFSPPPSRSSWRRGGDEHSSRWSRTPAGTSGTA